MNRSKRQPKETTRFILTIEVETLDAIVDYIVEKSYPPKCSIAEFMRRAIEEKLQKNDIGGA